MQPAENVQARPNGLRLHRRAAPSAAARRRAGPISMMAKSRALPWQESPAHLEGMIGSARQGGQKTTPQQGSRALVIQQTCWGDLTANLLEPVLGRVEAEFCNEIFFVQHFSIYYMICILLHRVFLGLILLGIPTFALLLSQNVHILH